MAKYKIEMDFDVGQESKLKSKAIEQIKEVEDILLDLANESVKGQVNQWVQDELTTKLESLTPSQALSRLKSFDV